MPGHFELVADDKGFGSPNDVRTGSSSSTRRTRCRTASPIQSGNDRANSLSLKLELPFDTLLLRSSANARFTLRPAGVVQETKIWELTNTSQLKRPHLWFQLVSCVLIVTLKAGSPGSEVLTTTLVWESGIAATL